LLAKYKPADTARMLYARHQHGPYKALAIAVLPNCQKPMAAKKNIKLSSKLILGGKNLCLAQSVLNFRISIYFS